MEVHAHSHSLAPITTLQKSILELHIQGHMSYPMGLEIVCPGKVVAMQKGVISKGVDPPEIMMA